MFKKGVLEKFAYSFTASDLFIVTEVLYQIKKNKLKIKEYSIIFLARLSGESKLRPITLIKYLFKVLKLQMAGKLTG